MVIAASNLEQYKSLINPGLQWAVKRGLRMTITAPKSLQPPRAYAQATEKYSGQVSLSPDGLTVQIPAKAVVVLELT